MTVVVVFLPKLLIFRKRNNLDVLKMRVVEKAFMLFGDERLE